MKGTLSIDEVIPFTLYFKPSAEGYLSAELNIHTSIEDYKYTLGGQGWTIKLDQSKIPDIIDFGSIPVGRILEFYVILMLT
jgi:hypothetical protein